MIKGFLRTHKSNSEAPPKKLLNGSVRNVRVILFGGGVLEFWSFSEVTISSIGRGASSFRDGIIVFTLGRWGGGSRGRGVPPTPRNSIPNSMTLNYVMKLLEVLQKKQKGITGRA